MREIDLKNSFYISLAIHLILFLLFSLFFLKNPFQKIETPTVVNIQFDNQLSGSQMKEEAKGALVEEKKLEEKVKEKVTPVKKEVKKNEVNEKLKEVKEKKEKLEKNIAEKPKEKEIPQTGNKENVKDEDDDLLKNIDEAIKTGSAKNNSTGEENKADVLSGGKWSGKARRTIFFPDIQSRLPDELRKKGIGYAVTAKIKFDKNGLATYVEIIKSSGNSKVDQIFNTELKKIRVEPAETIDEVIHTFRIQIR